MRAGQSEPGLPRSCSLAQHWTTPDLASQIIGAAILGGKLDVNQGEEEKS
jgi:hypothetical protein